MDCELTGPVSVDARGLFPNAKGPQFYNTPDRFFARMRYANGIELLYFASLNLRSSFGQVEKHVDTTKEQMQWMFGENVPEEIKTFNRDGIMFIGDASSSIVAASMGNPPSSCPRIRCHQTRGVFGPATIIWPTSSNA